MCLSKPNVTYNLTVPGWNASAASTFVSLAGARVLGPRTGTHRQSAARALPSLAGAQASTCRATGIRKYFLGAVAGTVQPPDSSGAGDLWCQAILGRAGALKPLRRSVPADL